MQNIISTFGVLGHSDPCLSNDWSKLAVSLGLCRFPTA